MLMQIFMKTGINTFASSDPSTAIVGSYSLPITQSWASKLQTQVALSTKEAEYIVM